MNSLIKRHGFTMIELMIVIAIIAILSFVLFPKGGVAKKSAKELGALQNKRMLEAYMEMRKDTTPKDLISCEEFKKDTNPFNKSQVGVGEWKDKANVAVVLCDTEEQLKQLDKGQIGILGGKVYLGQTETVTSEGNIVSPTIPAEELETLTSKTGQKMTKLSEGVWRIDNVIGGVCKLPIKVKGKPVKEIVLGEGAKTCKHFVFPSSGKYSNTLVRSFMNQIETLDFRGVDVNIDKSNGGFSNCTGLKHIEVDSYSVILGDLSNCTSLEDIHVTGKCRKIKFISGAFMNTNIKKIYGEDGSLNITVEQGAFDDNAFEEKLRRNNEGSTVPWEVTR